MKMPCFRCGKEIDAPNASNADYVIADDMIAKESKEALFSLEHNEHTRHKQAVIDDLIERGLPIPPQAQVRDKEYDWVELPDISASHPGEVKLVVKVVEKDIQKTGIICPGCYRDTDKVIWGVHKKKK